MRNGVETRVDRLVLPQLFLVLLKFHVFQLNNRVFLLRNYQLIVAPQKFDVLETNICPRNKAMRANILVFPRGDYQTISSETNNLSLLVFTTEFSSAHQFKNRIEMFSTFFR